ncbi:MAG: acyltransferase [Casimicrobiaceae bacterium]
MDETALPAKAERYYLIQCLRLFAASFVVVFHSVLYVSTHGGQLPREVAYYFGELSQLGILIFFAISGFVITSSIQRRTSSEFLWLRFLRIYPGFWLAIAIVIALNWAVFGGFAWNRGTIFGMTLLPLGDVPRPLGNIEWTLVYEVFFYALIALVWTTRSNRMLANFCLAWAAAIIVVAAKWPSWGTSITATFPRIALSAYNLAFIGGVLAFYIHRRLDLRFARTLFALAPGFAIGGEFFEQTEWKLLCVSLAAFCLVAGTARVALARDASRDGLLTQWGDASYGLYLIHNAVIVLVFNALIGVRQVHWLVGMLGLFAIGMGSGLLYGQLEHRLYGILKSRFPRAPWHRRPTAVATIAAPPG